MGIFPLDQQLELWDKHWSPELSKQMVWLSGVSPSYEKAEEVLARIGGLTVSDSSIWRQVERWGKYLSKSNRVFSTDAIDVQIKIWNLIAVFLQSHSAKLN